MVKKIKSSSGAQAEKPAAGKSAKDNGLASSVKESAHQIWLAGMGAFSKAQEEGTKVFESLVKEGMALQRKTQAVAEEKIGEVTGRMSEMASTVSAKAGQNWDKLEAIFEQRTAKAMGRLGVPTAKDVQALSERVEQLSAQVAKLSRASKSAASAGAAADAPKPRTRTRAAPVSTESAAEGVAAKAPARRARKTATAA